MCTSGGGIFDFLVENVIVSSSVTPTFFCAMILKRAFLSAILLSSIAVSPSAVLAWNGPGHMIVALIAYDQLDPATKAKAVALLREHPRFSSHFQGEMPREIQRK